MPAIKGLLPRVLSLLTLLCSWQMALAVPHVVAQSSNLAPVGSIEGPAELVRAEGKYLYVVAGPRLRIIDVTNPAAPRPVGAYTFSEHIRAFTVSGSIVYAAADFFGLRVLDASSPTAPVLRGSLEMEGGNLTIDLLGNNVLVATNLVSGLEVVDVSDVSNPVSLPSYFTDGYAQGVAASHPLVYVTDEPTGLYILDLSEPDSPVVVSVQETKESRAGGRGMPSVPSPLVGISESVVAPSSKIAVLLDRADGLLHIYDVSKPAAPVKVTTFNTLTRSENLKVRESRAYIAGGPAGIQVIDLSNPSKPVIVGTFKTTRPARDVAATDSLVFAATGNGGVVILRQSR
jgi:hypothetical protein